MTQEPEQAVEGRRFYTEADDAAIRDGWPDFRAVAAALDRSTNSILRRANKLGLGCPTGRPKRPFSAEELQAVRDRYPDEGAVQLARDLGRARADIVAVAGRLDVNNTRRWTDEDDRRLVEMRRAGDDCRTIAAALERTYAAVTKRIEGLGLAVPHSDPQARRIKLTTPRVPKQICETRWARVRIALGEHGWPPDLNPKEVAVLESLRLNGPQTRERLSLSVGEPASRQPKKRLTTHNGHSGLSRLLARSLVARLLLTEGRRRMCVYTLTAFAAERRGTFDSVREFNAAAAARGAGDATNQNPNRRAS